MKIVVTIPAYNEEKTLPAVIADVREVMHTTGHSFKIIVVDDGSTDKTAEAAQEAGAKVFRHRQNRGLAAAFNSEMKHALSMEPDAIVHIDADSQYQAKAIPKLLEKLQQGYDLVLGSRFQGKIESMPLSKRLGNRMFSAVISQLTGTRITDAQTGLRAFTKEVAQDISITSGFSYTQEQIIRAQKQGFRIAEVPVFFAKRQHGDSRLFSHPLEYGSKAGITLLRLYRDYRPLKFFGLLGSLFLLAGGLIGLYLVYLFLTTGVVGKLPTVMFAVLLISVGVQIILFGFLADMLRK